MSDYYVVRVGYWDRQKPISTASFRIEKKSLATLHQGNDLYDHMPIPELKLRSDEELIVKKVKRRPAVLVLREGLNPRRVATHATGVGHKPNPDTHVFAPIVSLRKEENLGGDYPPYSSKRSSTGACRNSSICRRKAPSFGMSRWHFLPTYSRTLRRSWKRQGCVSNLSISAQLWKTFGKTSKGKSCLRAGAGLGTRQSKRGPRLSGTTFLVSACVFRKLGYGSVLGAAERDSGVCGNLSGIRGSLSGFRGNVIGLRGRRCGLCGNGFGVRGNDRGLCGNHCGVCGRRCGLRGNDGGNRGRRAGICGNDCGDCGSGEKLWIALSINRRPRRSVALHIHAGIRTHNSESRNVPIRVIRGCNARSHDALIARRRPVRGVRSNRSARRLAGRSSRRQDRRPARARTRRRVRRRAASTLAREARR